jgi:hypothetical protein
MVRILQLIAALMAASTLQYASGPERAFAVVVHPSNQSRDLRVRDVTSIFGGTSRQWPNSSAIVLVERNSAGPSFQYLIGRLLNTTPRAYNFSLLNIEYRGEAPVSIKILNSDAAACQFVFNVPSAVALVESASLGLPACGAVRVLSIDGKLPGEEGYRLK